MAHNSFIRASGVWNNFSTVLKAEYEALDLAQFKSINGDDGGTWAPAAALIIGGAGFRVTGDGQFSSVSVMTMSSTNLVTYTSRSKFRIVPMFGFDSTGACFRLPHDVATGATFDMAVEVPDACTLTAVEVSIDPGAHGSMPGTPPSISVWKTAYADGTATQIGSTTPDPTTPVGSYNPDHTFSISGLSEVINRRTHYYWAQFTQESGANSVIGTVNGLKPTFTITQQDDAVA